MNILFICTGNTCRSPMAEHLLRHMLSDTHHTVSSAGLSAFDGDCANQSTVDVLNNYGIDASLHRSRRLNLQIIDDADIIFVMTDEHASVLTEHGVAKDKIHTLGIEDPYGCDLDAYSMCKDKLEVQLKAVINSGLFDE